MRGVKELSRWVDSFGLPSSPWGSEPADWATALNLLSRLLHQRLAQRVDADEEVRRKNSGAEGEDGEKPKRVEREESQQSQMSQQHPSTQLPFNEALQLAECVLGVPQLAVLADTKTRATADNQLAVFVTLFALRFAMGATETKHFREFQFTFRIYFDMDTDDSSRFCAACGQLVHLIERLLLAGRVWHRACAKCTLCGRQLYRGALLARADQQLECAEHFANRVLFGDPKHRFALPPSSSIIASATTADQNKRASIASSAASPPPRPPPPKIGTTPAATTTPTQQKEDEESIEKKLALAAAATHDAPVPKPRSTKPLGRMDTNKIVGQKAVGEKAAWEVLEYPEELNPFGSEEEDELHHRPDSTNPFDDDDDTTSGESSSSEDEGEEEGKKKRKDQKHQEDDEEEEEGMVQVRNPQDRVQACGSSGSPSPTEAPRAPAPIVHVVKKEETEEEEKRTMMPEGTKEEKEKRVDPEPAGSGSAATEGEEELRYQYIPPLAPMLFRTTSLGQLPDPVALRPGSDHSVRLYELDTRLRKLHAHLDQWEITGTRLEGQLLREMAKKEKPVWRKGAKLANAYAHVLEQRLTGLATEAVLVRRYMDTFLEVAHAELDRQMKQAEDPQKFGALLACLLQMRNELSELDSRERSTRASIAREAQEREAAMAAVKGGKKHREKEKETAKEQKAEKETTADTQSVASSTGTKSEGKEGGGGAKEQRMKLVKNPLRDMKQTLAKTLKGGNSKKQQQQI